MKPKSNITLSKRDIDTLKGMGIVYIRDQHKEVHKILYEDGFAYNFNLWNNPRFKLYYNITDQLTDEELSEIETHLEIFESNIEDYISTNIKSSSTSGSIHVTYDRSHLGLNKLLVEVEWSL